MKSNPEENINTFRTFMDENDLNEIDIDIRENGIFIKLPVLTAFIVYDLFLYVFWLLIFVPLSLSKSHPPLYILGVLYVITTVKLIYDYCQLNNLFIHRKNKRMLIIPKNRFLVKRKDIKFTDIHEFLVKEKLNGDPAFRTFNVYVKHSLSKTITISRFKSNLLADSFCNLLRKLIS